MEFLPMFFRGFITFFRNNIFQSTSLKRREQILFKVKNNDTKITSMDVVIDSLLLTFPTDSQSCWNSGYIVPFPANIYLSKVNNRNSRKKV